MNENQKKWLLDLQSKGVKFEYCNINDEWVDDGKCTFSASQEKYRIQAQPIPDIPDWRELCREMQSKGVEFEAVCGDGSWKKSRPYFFPDFMGKEDYRIPQQPITKWREEMTEEAEPDPREEIPHRELQIQWHEDMLHHLRTGEPMKKWQCKPDGDNRWFDYTGLPTWDRDCEYRRKPRTVKYWHCVARAIIDEDKGPCNVVLWSTTSMDDMEREINIMKRTDSAATFTTIIETTAELAD